ncbi:nicotinate-nucleotide--dimethylbenzimidazole phosphoribosyltransferase [Streptomyces sp. NPDC047725]|uniref:nicotinate-nucleotide--dimethylbenzimidazole phosphoribosyltransferase n=1 Tax=Streptomyces sp. NPDC047725 TaxID=3365487 RepID=UPI0037187129
MTDTGQIPGEGLPENAGMVEQPGVPAPGAYTYLSETTAEDEDLLLLPGAQSAWGNEVAPPAPEPVVETVHQPGPHEMSGRDSGSVDLSGVRLPEPAAAPAPPRRPLHLGPPIPDTSASPVRSLADRGPADVPVRHPGPPTVGPEYLDVAQTAAMPPQGAAPWGAQATPAETVVPVPEQHAGPAGAAQALVSRVATEAVAATGGVPASGQETPGEAAAPTADAGAAQAGDTAPGDGTTDGAGTVLAPGAGAPVADGAAADGAAVVEGTAVAGGGAAAGGALAADEAVSDGGSATEAGTATDGAAATEGAAVTEAGSETEGTVATEGAAVPDGDPTAVPVAEGFSAPDGGAEAGDVQAPVTDGAPASAEVPVAAGPATDGAPAQDAMREPAHGPDAAHAPDAVPAPDAEPGPAAVPATEAAQAPEAGVPTDAPEPVLPAEAPEAVAPSEAEAPETEATTAARTAETPAPVATPTAAEAPEAVQAAAVPAAPETEAAQTAAPGTVPPGESAPSAEAGAPEPAPVAETSPEPAAEASGQPATTEAPAAAEPTTAPAPQQPAAATQPAPATEPAPADAQAAAEPAPADVPQATPPAGTPLPQDAQAPEVPGPEAGAPEPAPQAPAAPQVPAAAREPVAPQTHVAAEAATPQPAPAENEAPQPHAPARPAAQGPQSLTDTDTDTPREPAQPAAPHADQPVGRFVQVDGGQVPTTPHLAPTPPEGLVLPSQAQEAPAAAPAVEIPAPREADTDVVQNADDLDTRGADQEDQEDPQHVSTAEAADVRQPAGPAAPAYDDAEREAVLKVMRERRDIRNGFRSDPIPHEVLLRVLEAAHTAPSVGHSQPWDFVVIRSDETRRAMHELATRQREAYAKSLPKGRAKQFKELKIEAILDTPVNIVVTADPTRGGRHTLGRHTQPQMAPYSSALAVENLWLAARAEGLGVGWVSFFDEREMVRVLGLPEHLEVVAYLCVGYVDEFPDEPELMQAGWSKRRPLSWVVHEETYGRRALPGEDPHDLLAETVAQIRPLDAKALGEAWERQKRMTKPAGALGMLEIISAQLSGLSRQCPPPIPEPAAVAVFAGDHGVHAQGVTPWPQEVTAQMVANFLGGGAVCNAFATQVGAEVCVVDVGVAADLPATPGLLPRKVRAGTSDMTTGPAMTREEAKQAIEVGIETARDLVAAGNKALLTGEMGIANTTASAALISVFTGADPAEVTGRGTGINDETLARKTEVVRRALEVHQPDPADPVGVLAAVGGFEHAAMVGLLLGGASLRTPVILDGVSAGAAALVARAIAPEVLAACIAGHRSAEPGHVAALNKLGLRPLVDLDLRLGEGTGALLALPMVQSTARAMHEVATFDSAGVTEK